MSEHEMAENVIIRIQELTKCYGEKTAVSNLSLEIRKGEIFGLLGPNGAGKTTTTLMLLGLTEPTSGAAWIDGKDCIRDPIAIKRITGYLPDNVGFYADMTGRENLRFTGRLNGLPEPVIEERITSLLEKVGMTDAADQKAGTYSRGMKQRLGIADVLMKDPKVVILDEPTLGIDPEGMRELIQLIRRLAEEDGRTILISSHQLHQIQQICDRVGLFVDGTLIACGTIEELAKQMQQEGCYVLETAALPDNPEFPKLLESLGNVNQVEREGEVYVVRSSWDIKRELIRRSLDAGFTLTHLRQRGNDLDEIYRRYFEKAEVNHGDDHKKKQKRFAGFGNRQQELDPEENG
ncbi:MAG: ABC transporter ATP-binding protein [Lachnospiraceae bacterium]|nr:ABC transporter ATP-binding protein [Lachnospiraceae bacterium]